MRAIHVRDDHDRTLYLDEAPDPRCSDEEVVIKVHATAVNRADLLQRRGHYPPPPGESEILGLEASGEIIQLGSKAKGWHVGDRVFCLLPGGSYAELVKCHKDMLLPVPSKWSYEQAAAVPEAFYTAYVNLFMEARLKAGEILLLHAGGSGVGTAAIQMARHAGALVIVTTGSAEKMDRCRSLGANHAINYKNDEFGALVLKLTNGTGVDVILDCIGASYLETNLEVLKPMGRMIIIGLLGGAKANIDLAAMLRKRLCMRGSVLRIRTLEEKIIITQQFRQKVGPRFEDGSLRPVIDSVFPLHEAMKAHEHVAANRNFGKVVLKVDQT